jgi:NAD(P) transhydrogenase
VIATYDFIAIGAGPAGEAAAELAAFFGHRSAVVEYNKPGGTVTTTGGVPTKTLREAALYITGFRERDVYGLEISEPPHIAGTIIRNRTRNVCESLQRLTLANIAKNGVEYIHGHAQLGTNHSVTIGEPDGRERMLRARIILIATGSSPVRPSHIPLIPGVCDTQTVLDERLAKDILIVGGGAVGVEFATIYNMLGSQVTIAERGDRLIGMMDGEMCDRLAGLLTKRGICLKFASTVDAIVQTNGQVQVNLSIGETFIFDTVLFAAGRTPNTHGLGLEEAGIKLGSGGRIAVDKHLRTSAAGVYAAGDVIGPTLASIAMEQGRAAVCHAFDIPFEGIVDPAPVSAVYGMPEVAGAGLTEEQCREQGLDYEVGRSDFDFIPRGAIAGRGGLLKLIFLKDGRRLVGAHCLGDIASELVGIGQMAIRCGGTINTIANMSMNTPTYSYAYKYAAFDGLRRLAARRIREQAMA